MRQISVRKLQMLIKIDFMWSHFYQNDLNSEGILGCKAILNRWKISF